jgi:hypothetical protein
MHDRSRILRSIALRIVECVPLGCIATVLVAWCFSLFVDVGRGWHELGHGTALHQGAPYPPNATGTDLRLGWGAEVLGTLGREYASIWYQWAPANDRFLTPGQTRANAFVRTLNGDAVPDAIVHGPAIELARIVEASGWPFLALTDELSATSTSKLLPRRGGLPIAWDFRWFAKRPVVGRPAQFALLAPPGAREIPIQPIWFGFVADTIFYAVLSAGLWMSFLVARNRRRWKKGNCPRCAHPLAGAPRCPECGFVSGLSAA